MEILFVASEAMPFIKTGGLGDVMGALPKAIVREGHEVHVIIPKYQAITANYEDQLTFNSSFEVVVGYQNYGVGIYYVKQDNIH
ncbi:MAG: glycogen/starch synthase, partial [Bacilli bacterium]